MNQKKITPEDIMVYEVSMAIHMWIHHTGDKINDFTNGVDRVANICEVVREAIKKAKKNIIRHADHPLMDKEADGIIGMDKTC